MITGTIIGDRELLLRMRQMPERTKQAIDRTVMALGFELEAYVKSRKLSGQILKVRTGRLRASISQSSAMKGGDSRSGFVSTSTQAVYTVGTNVDYGAAWEFGSRARTIVATRAKALRFEINGVVFFRRKVTIPTQPARPFLSPALNEQRAHIVERITAAAQQAAAVTLKP